MNKSLHAGRSQSLFYQVFFVSDKLADMLEAMSRNPFFIRSSLFPPWRVEIASVLLESQSLFYQVFFVSNLVLRVIRRLGGRNPFFIRSSLFPIK